jgi:hypothetical protein
MGLDQYLERRHYVQRWNHTPADKQFEVTVTQGGQPYALIQPERVSYVIEQVAYWRKANAIHRWFVEHVQNGEDDCREHPVPYEKLCELFNLVGNVFAGVLVAADALPTESGFFFGSTEYGADYREDLKETRRQLAPLIAEGDQYGMDYYYRASW